MNAVGRLMRLTRHPAFRRLVIVRLLSQGGDGVVQVGMATYIVFSPQSQPNAAAIAGVVALVMLPFSVVGPFVSPILDRFPRQRITIVCDIARAGLTLVMAFLVGTDRVAGGWQAWLYVLLLVTLSLNRLQLAALGAGMPYTVDSDEYLEAASVMPMIGPSAAIFGGLAAAAIRLGSGRVFESWQADGLVFLLAGIMFVCAVSLTTRFARMSLGPDRDAYHTSWGQALSGFSVAMRELTHHRPAFIGILAVHGVKIGYGILMTTAVIVYRHVFHSPDDSAGAMVGIGVWFLASGVGFAVSGLVATPLSARIGVRATTGWAFVAGTVVAALPIWHLGHVALVVIGLVTGLGAQTVKVCSDTVVQAHVPDWARGRVMVIYDILNNLGVVVGACLAALVLPDSGRPVAVFVWLTVLMAGFATAFWLSSRGDASAFDRGTVLLPDEPLDRL
ncbi:MFS transporter [Brooklawnia cerclae]|uniref:MFS family permease n=1 Tax=Brooklawnia cerclae TaxID=349934 RepID=A0ABX0SMU1_9ACTN|nr:MFS transporter [Brooklawnia cerclae]NIH58086.1 MFS family permease [Brooklawnia cerclae]